MNAVEQREVVAALLSYAEVSTLLGVKVGTLYAWTSRKVIPFVRLSPRVVRFKREEIEAWMQQRSVSPVAAKIES